MYRFAVCLTAALCVTAALVSPSTASAATAPAAYAFVSTANPNDVYTLAVSPTGSFTHVGTASSPTAIYHLSVTKHFLFGIDNLSNIYTYSISSTGALKLVATTHAGKYVSGFSSQYSAAIIQVDETGTTLYTLTGSSQTDWFLESFKIESNGDLQFLGSSYADPNALNQIRFVQGGQYALTDGCYNTAAGASFVTDSDDVNDIVTYKHESNGFLTYVGTSNDTPTAQSPYEYCAGLNASDSTDHVAVGFTIFNPPGDNIEPGMALGTYTVNTSGTPGTTSDYENMPVTSGFDPYVMSIDPTGRLLAVGGTGAFQLYHFNGANPVMQYSGVIKTNDLIRSIAWDKSSHMYLLTDHSVDIYNISTTSYTELKPWEFTGPYSMIVQTL
ncbi:MAG TPA: hypothetical protein VGG26_11750 [Terracidiphilus sp.]|jgi:hypothetical protein